MKFRALGRPGILVPVVSLRAPPLSALMTRADVAAPRETVAAAVQAGPTPFDTLLGYRHGQSAAHPGRVLAHFSPSECQAMLAVVRAFPDAASHEMVGAAVWGSQGFDRYQIHRLLQRARQRMGDHADLLENVRAAGYRTKIRVHVA